MKIKHLIPITSIALISSSSAISVVIDYSLDTLDFFGAGNPDGAPAGATAKSALEAAASFFSDSLTDDFDAIVPTGGNTWDITFTHPGTGAAGHAISNPSIASDTVIIYAGGRALAGSTRGKGGPGGFSAGGIASWFTAIRERGEGASTESPTATEFAPWGGVVTFDNDTVGQWHYDHTTTAGLAGKSDFYSVALHELAHVLGFGTADSWDDQTTGPAFGKSFTGAKATAANGGTNPLLQTDLDPPGHLISGTMSTVFQGVASQEAAMDPSITSGTRKLMTELDMAVLDDLGWDVVPEPSSSTMIVLSGMAFVFLRKRR